MKEASPYIYPGLADMYSQQLSAAVFISHSAYKLISCCFHLFCDPLFAVSVYWQVCLMKRDGRVKQPANRSEFVHSFEFLKTCDQKLCLNSLHSTAQKTYHSPRHFIDDLRGLFSNEYFITTGQTPWQCNFQHTRRCLKKQPLLMAPIEWRNAMALRRKLSGSPVEVRSSIVRLEFIVLS